jgi:dipeptidyl aminopeptidase/acylaminoacyl peptidase
VSPRRGVAALARHHRPAAVATAFIVQLALAAAASAPAGHLRGGTGGSRDRTIATIGGRVAGFAQDERYLAWALRRGGVTFLDLRTRTRTSASRKRVPTLCGLGSEDLLLARDRAFWAATGGSNTTYYMELCTAATSDHKVRDVDFQSIDNESTDVLVQPASDGRSVYFWSSPEDATPGPLVRYDGRRRTRLTGTIASLSALAAGGGRVASAVADWTYDCAQDPAWSPDGTHIAFADNLNKPASQIFTMTADGRDLHQLTHTTEGGGAADPSYSPDGSQIAFDSDQSHPGQTAEIHVVDVDGTDEHTITTSTPALLPDWSGEAN